MINPDSILALGHISNKWISISIDLDTSSRFFGCVREFKYKQAGQGPGQEPPIFASAQDLWFLAGVGDKHAQTKRILQHSGDTVVVELSGFGKGSLTWRMCYFLREERLILRSRAWVDERTDFPEGMQLEVRSGFKRGFARNHSKEGVFRDLSGGKSFSCHNKNFLSLFNGSNAVDSLVFFNPNPFHAFWNLNARGQGNHSFHLLPVVESRGKQGSPASYSSLMPLDTVERTLEIYSSRSRHSAVYFSEHPDGYFNSLTMFWDELPNRDNWAFMTTESDRSVRYDHNFVKLLNRNPKRKMGYLFLLDRMLTQEPSHVYGWDLNSPYIIPDSLENVEGDFCLNLREGVAPTTQKMSQTIACKPYSAYTLRYRIKTDGIKGTGAYGEVYGSTGTLIGGCARVTGSKGWTDEKLDFQTQGDTSLTVYLRMEKSIGAVSFDNAEVTEIDTDSNLLANGDFQADSPLESWVTNTESIISDSLTADPENTFASLDPSRKGTQLVRQTLTCRPRTTYTLSYRIMAEGAKGTKAWGEVCDTSSGKILAAGPVVTDQAGWEKVEVSFRTGKDTPLTLRLRKDGYAGSVFFDDIVLTQAGKEGNLLVNGGFEANTPGFIYDNVRRHWSDAHGKEYLLSHAPQTYLDFLKRVEGDSLVYGWEDRVSLGCHGYHHTPAAAEPDPMHEFFYHDSLGDSLRVHRIFTETPRIGLTKKSLRYWRTPGIKYTSSLLHRLVDSGVVFVDMGRTEPSHSCFLQRGGHRMWLNGYSFWGDVFAQEEVGLLTRTLKQGHLAQLGAHPEALFAFGKYDYQRFENMLALYEQFMPTMGYVLPDEWADNANAVYELNKPEMWVQGRDVIFSFEGTTRKGNTIIFNGRSEAVLFNGKPAAASVYEDKTYIVLPDGRKGSHMLTIRNAVTPTTSLQSNSSDGLWSEFKLLFLSRQGGMSLNLDAPNYVSLEVFSLKGERVQSLFGKRLGAGRQRIAWNMEGLQAGIWLVRLQVGPASFTRKFLLP